MVGSDDSALEQSPKRLNRIGVNLASNVLAARVRHRFVADTTSDVVVILIIVGRDQFNAVADDLANESSERNRVCVSDDPADELPLRSIAPITPILR